MHSRTHAPRPSPPTNRPPLLRLAYRIAQQLNQQGGDSPVDQVFDSLAFRTSQLMALSHRWSLCRQYHLHAAALKVQDDLRYNLLGLSTSTSTALADIANPPQEVSVRDIAQELEALEEEFPTWRYEPEEQALIVETAPIVLEDINLGRFAIRLLLRRLNSPHYRVVALDPNPAACNSSVTHPHVRDEELCEGDAATPLRLALRQGRIGDVFTMIRCVLETYNAGSPYVSLDSWDGHPCTDCGDIMDQDDSRSCSGCDCDFCDNCISYCRRCDDSRCVGCLKDCAACGDSICRACLETCKGCQARCCASCLEEGLCPDCVPKPEENNQQQEEGENHGDDHGKNHAADPADQPTIGQPSIAEPSLA